MSNTDKRGRFIVIEGTEGSGKSTLSQNVKKYIESLGFNAVVIASPTEGHILYKQIRDVLKHNSAPTDTIQTMIMANMKDCINSTIVQYLASGTSVIMDRWMLSSIVYSVAEGGHVCESMAIDYGIHHPSKIEPYEDSIIDLYTASREFSDHDVYPDKIFYIYPPMSLLVKHAKERAKDKNAEFNDVNIDNISMINKLYYNMYLAVNEGGIVNFNGFQIADTKLDKVDDHKLISLSISERNDDSLTESDIYKIMENKVYNEIKTLF